MRSAVSTTAIEWLRECSLCAASAHSPFSAMSSFNLCSLSRHPSNPCLAMIDLVPLLIIGAGVLQLPLIMDAISHLFPQSRIGRAVTGTMRALLLTCMMASVTLALYMQLVILLPERLHRALEDEKGSRIDEVASWPASLLTPAGYVHVLLSVWLYVQLSSYFFAACAEPASRIRPPAKSGALISAPAGNGVATDGDDSSASKRWCAECNVPKLLRTHHCRVCRVCVELMDHHCPFTGNCVGLSNFRAFYLWLCFGLLGVAYATACAFQPFRDCVWAGIPHTAEVDAIEAAAAVSHAPVEHLTAAAMAAEASRSARIALWRSVHGSSCDRLGDAAWLFLPAFFGLVSTFSIWAAQSALLRADQTTVEWLHNASQMKVKIAAPEEVRKDAEARKAALARSKGGANGSNGGAVRRQQVGAFTNGHADFDHSELDADALESGTPSHDQQQHDPSSPISDAFAHASSASSSSSSSSSFPASSPAYNPHKSFRRLVLQGLPWWTLLLPPWALSKELRNRAQQKMMHGAD